jgi:hypothetical protein
MRPSIRFEAQHCIRFLSFHVSSSSARQTTALAILTNDDQIFIARPPRGLAEMARVTRPGGYGVVATWQDRGAATFLLVGQIRRKLFPEREGMTMPEAVRALSDPEDFARELVTAGHCNPRIELVVYDYELDIAALDEPDTLFGMSPDWTSLTDAERVAVIAEVRQMTFGRSILPVPSTALIPVAQR